jgi:hypothetical protein
MKRFGYLAVLMVLSSSAYAGEQVSFTVAGHRVRIEGAAILPISLLRLRFNSGNL